MVSSRMSLNDVRAEKTDQTHLNFVQFVQFQVSSDVNVIWRSLCVLAVRLFAHARIRFWGLGFYKF